MRHEAAMTYDHQGGNPLNFVVAVLASMKIALLAAAASMAIGALAGFHSFLKRKGKFRLKILLAMLLSSTILSLGSAALIFGVLPIEKWNWQTFWIAIFLSASSGFGTNQWAGGLLAMVRAVFKLRGGP